MRGVLFLARLRYTHSPGKANHKVESMSELTYSIDKDLKEAQAMVGALVPYIYENELYGHLGYNMPSLTLGALLLRLRRLHDLGERLTDAQLASLRPLESQHLTLRKEWSSHYDKKLAREAEIRLRDIQTFCHECRDDPQGCASAYLPEALRRTLVHEILQVLPNPGSLDFQLKKTDFLLQGQVRPADFIWDRQLQPVYPADVFWWLYRRPPQPGRTGQK
jgi:hypothetical protein